MFQLDIRSICGIPTCESRLCQVATSVGFSWATLPRVFISSLCTLYILPLFLCHHQTSQPFLPRTRSTPFPQSPLHPWLSNVKRVMAECWDILDTLKLYQVSIYHCLKLNYTNTMYMETTFTSYCATPTLAIDFLM